MAGDWIKMRADLFTHPKVVRIVSALNADNLRVVGALMSAWCLFDVHSEEGILEGYTPELLDAHLQWNGFSRAMIAVGWLKYTEKYGLELPRFDCHNGQSSKRRAMETERKRDVRKVSASDADSNVRKVSASDADKKRTREEKRREEKKETIVSSPIPPTALDAEVWNRWAAYRRQIGSALKPASVAAAQKKLAELGSDQAAAVEQSIANGWKGLFPPRTQGGQGGGGSLNRREALEVRNRAAADRWVREQERLRNGETLNATH